MNESKGLKRRLLPAVALTTLSVLLAGCGAEEPVAGEPEAVTDTEGATEPSDGSDCAEFYDGETIRLVVPYDPGGGFDVYARAFAPYLEEQLSGVRVNVENVPGAGGLIGANEVFQAEGDGTTIGLINFPGAVFAEETGKEGVALENTEWTFLGRVAAVNPLVYASEESGITSAEDLVNAEDEVVFGIGGVGSDAYYATRVLGETLGFPYEIIAGYPGSGEADAALLAGEVEASVNSIDSALQTLESGNAVPLLFISTEPSDRLPEVPTAVSVADEAQQAPIEALSAIYDLERILVAPPGVPEERAQCLGEASFAALTDDEFEAELEAADRTLNPLSRQETVDLAETATAGLEDLRPLLGEE